MARRITGHEAGAPTSIPVPMLFLHPGAGAPGSLDSGVSVAGPDFDDTLRLQTVTLSSTGDNKVGRFKWSFLVPEGFAGFGSTAFKVGVKLSSTSGNNTITCTVKDTSGSTVLSAASIKPSDTNFVWKEVLAASLSAGTYDADGVVSVELAVTLDTSASATLAGVKVDAR